MDRKEVIRRVTELVNKEDLNEIDNPAVLGTLLIEVLAGEYEELSERAVESLLMVAACLLRDHVDAVEKDILAAREIYRRR